MMDWNQEVGVASSNRTTENATVENVASECAQLAIDNEKREKSKSGSLCVIFCIFFAFGCGTFSGGGGVSLLTSHTDVTPTR